MTTSSLNWTKNLGTGRFTVVNGYKVVELLGTRKIPPMYVIEPLGVDSLPIKGAQAGGTAHSLESALRLTERPFCRGCGHTVVSESYIYPDPDLGCPQ